MPSWKWYRFVKIRNIEAPITISGVTSGNSIRKLAEPEPRPRHRASPIARPTPSAVAIGIVSSASFRLCMRAGRSVSSKFSDASFQIASYHCVLKPWNVLRERPALNENWTAIRTGAIDQMMYSHVQIDRNRGLPHGLAKNARSRPTSGGATAAARATVACVAASVAVTGEPPWPLARRSPGSRSSARR